MYFNLPFIRAIAEIFHRSSLENSHHHIRRSLGHAPRRLQRNLGDIDRSTTSSRGNGEYDEDSLRQLLLE